MAESFGFNQENDQSLKNKISEYSPMQIERRADGQLYLPNGTEVLPNIPVGSEEYHLRLFVEYEQTFGRGNAKYQTHFGEENPISEEKYGSDFISEYHRLSNRYGQITIQGTLEEVESLIQELKLYQTQHRGLYTDAATHTGDTKARPSRIKIISQHNPTDT